MFTGIVEEVGIVVEAQDGFVKVRGEHVRDTTRLGDSIAVDGVDLTVTRLDGSLMSFDVMPETYRCTNLARLETGRRVNLERSVRSEDRLSGHVVRGVVEGTGKLRGRRDDGAAVILDFEAPGRLLANIVPRGPICIDGVSLTVIGKTETTFSVSLVNFTQAHTTMLELEIGDEINLETDIMIRYISQLLEARGLLASESGDEPAEVDTVAAWQAYKAKRS